jgi:hypothetical protein
MKVSFLTFSWRAIYLHVSHRSWWRTWRIGFYWPFVRPVRMERGT